MWEDKEKRKSLIIFFFPVNSGGKILTLSKFYLKIYLPDDK